MSQLLEEGNDASYNQALVDYWKSKGKPERAKNAKKFLTAWKNSKNGKLEWTKDDEKALEKEWDSLSKEERKEVQELHDKKFMSNAPKDSWYKK
jgi:hypothetical protein